MNRSADTNRSHLCDFAAGVLAKRLEQMFSYAEGARQGDQTRPIHQMRVWSRRARAAHDLFTACFPGKEYRALGREIKAVTDALGEARDLDVMIEMLQAKCSAAKPEHRVGIEAFIDHLKAERQDRQHHVERAVRRLEKRNVRRRFDELLAKYGVEPALQAASQDAEERAGDD